MKRLCCAYSVGKAERTAVQEVLMGCAEESPLLTPQRETSAEEISPVGNDAPITAREKDLQPYEALDCFGWRSEASGKPFGAPAGAYPAPGGA